MSLTKTASLLQPMRIAEAEQLSFVAGATVSPDGQRIVFSVLSTDSERARDTSRLWMLDLTTDESTPLPQRGVRDMAPAFSPDGRSLAFLSDVTGVPQIHVMDLESERITRVTDLERGVGPGSWSPDGSMLVFLAGPQELRDPTAVYRVTRTVWRMDEGGLIEDCLRDIWVVAADGTDLRRLTAGERLHVSATWADDGLSLISNTAFGYPEHDGGSTQLLRIPLDGTSPTPLSDGGSVIAQSAAMRGGGVAYVEGFQEDVLVGTRTELMVRCPDGSTSCRTTGHPLGLGGGLQPDMPTGASTGGSRFVVAELEGRLWAYVAVQVGGTVEIHRIALEGEIEWHPVMQGQRSCVPVSVTHQTVVSVVTSMLTPWDLHVCGPEGEDERRLTTMNDAVLATLELPEVHGLHFPGPDGADVEGWVLTPQGSAAPHPAVLCIHGGPHSGYGHVFSIDAQLLVGAGYAVIMINQRGSTGYGDAFATAINGDWGNLDYLDLMAGVDAAVAAGLVDDDRLAVHGVSGGGNLSCWIVGQTDRFKAAMPENPVTDWVSFQGTSDVGAVMPRRELGGEPHEVMETYRRCSPLTYAHRCTTPTLMIQAELDYRCPAEQSEQFFRALRAAGCTVEMLRMPGVPHAGSIAGPVPIRRAHDEALLEWVDRWVGGQTPAAEPAP